MEVYKRGPFEVEPYEPAYKKLLQKLGDYFAPTSPKKLIDKKVVLTTRTSETVDKLLDAWAETLGVPKATVMYAALQQYFASPVIPRGTPPDDALVEIPDEAYDLQDIPMVANLLQGIVAAKEEAGGPPVGYFLYDLLEDDSSKMSRMEWLREQYPRLKSLKAKIQDLRRELSKVV